MPVYRSFPTRRSRRLSMQQPRNYNEDDLESMELMYPEPESESIKIVVPNPSLACPSTSLRPPSSSTTPPFCPSPQPRHRPSNHVARPPNAFMLFRSHFWAQEKRKAEPIERDHRDISRIAAHCWNNLDEASKAPFQRLAEQRKLEHKVQHPDYKYAPVSAKKRPTKNKVKKNAQDEEERCRQLACFVMAGVQPGDLNEALKQEQGSTEAARTASPSTPARDPVLFLATPPHVKDEPSPTPSLVYDAFDTCLFVPTEDIPYLELSKGEIKQDKTYSEDRRTNLYDPIDSQFGWTSRAPSNFPLADADHRPGGYDFSQNKFFNPFSGVTDLQCPLYQETPPPATSTHPDSSFEFEQYLNLNYDG
ncbi:hypothetical protein BDN72DRAFT_5542 [Pluteus cervinus]|uniref:Uncharacterized protein n=1 Tax=Pluteus cervinus TaxID=181527 RepID=A0ACD3BFQ5_9AGAR|nr:hypothetical protein BDN72DRAFT_5542 [Pluteus cervinus]